MAGPIDRPSADADGSDLEEQRLEALLARAGELLKNEQIEAADREVAEAIRVAPEDPRALNLLGLVRFRSGNYDDAYDVYRSLVARDADDSALRLNLGLVELRMGKNAEAALSLRHVVEREPENLKAQGYLGLALMRAGELTAAREAFLAAGQPDLVRQVDEQLAAAPRSLSPAPSGPANGLHAPVNGAASRPTLLLDPGPEPLGPGAAIAAAAGRAAQQGIELPVGAITLGRFVERAELRVPAGEPFAIGAEQMLVVHVDGRLHMRTSGAVASSGRLAYAPITRRVRGRITEEPFGEGDDAMVAASGTGTVVIAPRVGRFTALKLTESQDVLYLRESAVFAFEENLSWENGRVPGGASSPASPIVVQFRGQGRVVMRSRKAPVTLRLGQGEVFYVDQAALLGWIGQVVPQQLRGADGEATQFVACSGEGALILEEPVPVLEEVQSIG